MTRKILMTLSAFLLTTTFPLWGQTKKEKWVTYQDKTYPFSFVYPETIREKNLKDEYEIVFPGWNKEPKIGKKPLKGVRYIVTGGVGESHYQSPYELTGWMYSFEGLAIVIFESSSALKSALDKEIKLAQKEEACRANGYTIRKSTVTMKGGIKAADHFFCRPRWEPGMDEGYTWLETVIWRIPKGLPEHVVLILHYEIPVKKEAVFIWKTDEEYEGYEEFVEKTPQSYLRAIEGSRKDALKTLNSFKWEKSKK